MNASELNVGHTGQSAQHAQHYAGGTEHGSVRSYSKGLLLSVAMTAAAFGIVMSGALSSAATMAVIVGLCVAQLLVQLVYFLHLGFGTGQRGNAGIFICTALVIAIVVAGSLWVMRNANLNMMPTDMSVERARAKD
ncbi:cytochrome o ubiquinol oxidase subunit IV [Ralstonia soli]|uniref:Cytochrome bo(3) ubiquinol oxidase subunit 4 n=1 Tax=Ralstonia soli TaxID=2953896 RepID=A0ABT1ALG6_9RALS|nr:cytochrome o ubiquinol oxidase subunit IV [Ralstonia soli]MCO5399124.1 cytochrome o ubiquinol oxidase subunit IV [Ralstonia soli]